MTTFFLVRHAVTSHTGRRLSGRIDGVPLTTEGRDQAEAVAGSLERFPLDAVYSSPLERTYETARPIAARHRLRVKTSAGLGEVDYGDWTDRPLKSLMRTKLWEVVQTAPSRARFPNGESILEVQDRAVTDVERLGEVHRSGTVCCVSHGDVIKLILAHYLGVHIDLFQRIVVAPASVSAVAIGTGAPRVLAMNATFVPSGRG